jgi:hypothetical protein
MKPAASSSKQLREQRGNGGRMKKKKSVVKRILGASAFALVASSVVLVSAAPNVIDMEPEECRTVCYYIMGVPIYCYEICF